ncbi:hypothetical protein EHV86_005456 [Escherichia coli]|nr:hypothetical protein [Escherichia coli]EJO9114838.1 hypothetical protein [Escherichia coli]
MKNIQKSLCSVAVVLGLTMTSQAWAAEEPTLFNDAGTTPSLSSPSSTPLISDTPAPVVSAPAPVTQVAPVVTKAPEVAKTPEVKKEEKDYSSTAQGNVLRKVAYLQSEFALKKIEKDISELDGKKDTDNGQVNGQMPVNQQGYPSGNLPPLPRTATTGVPQVVVPEEPAMQATAVYSLGNQSYAEIVVNGNKFVAKQGMKLPNGYKVSSMNELGVTLVKGKKKAVLPVSSVSVDSDSVQAPVAPIPAGFRQ